MIWPPRISLGISSRISVARLARVALVLCAALLVCSVAQACPSCKESLASSDPSKAGLVRGFFWSILFMMSMPFALLGSFGGYMYLQVRRARAAKAAEDSRARQASVDEAASPDAAFSREAIEQHAREPVEV